MGFPERLKELRTQCSLTQGGLGKVVGLTDRSIRMYEAGTMEPRLSILVAFADYFKVSLDDLVGRGGSSKQIVSR